MKSMMQRAAVPSHRAARGAVAASAPRRVAAFAKGTGNFIVGGNWKSNGSTASIEALVSGLNAGASGVGCEVVCGAPFVYLRQTMSTLDSSKFAVAAQNCWEKGPGAYTGEVGCEMLKDIGVPWVILGHSERRALCGESDEIVADKVVAALAQGLKVIACIGETLEQREAGQTIAVCERQLQAIVDKVGDWSDVVVAYEPVWAIGTGKVATPAQAQDVHAAVRAFMASKIGAEAAGALRIQYGGSVNPGNCDELAGMEDIDGFLVGGASLKADDFLTICASAQHSA